MATVSNSNLLSDPSILAKIIIAVTSWIGDPAVMTAIASLLTALAAFWRSRQRRGHASHVAPQQQQPAPSLADAYSTLHEAEEKIRVELLQQLQHLQEEAERIGQDLSFYRQATVKLEEVIIRCPYGSCPVREELKSP
jgi:hypothetical protein